MKFASPRAFAVLLFAAADLGAAIPIQDAPPETLIAALDGLGVDATQETFLQRPALLELMAQADRAAPALSQALLSSPSWSVRASAAYILAANGFFDHHLEKGWTSLLSDQHPAVRMIVAATAGPNSAARDVLAQPDVAKWAGALDLPWSHGTDWMPDAFRQRRLERFQELAASMDPYATPLPAWDDVAQAHLSPLAVAVQRTLIDEVQFSTHGHDSLEGLLRSAEAATAQRQDRLTYFLELSSMLPSHGDASHDASGRCPKADAIAGRLTSLADKHVWNSQDPTALRAMVSLLLQLAADGYVPAQDLLHRLLKEHPDLHVRGQAEWAIADLKDGARRGAERQERRIQKLSDTLKAGLPDPTPKPRLAPPDAAPRDPSRKIDATPADAPAAPSSRAWKRLAAIAGLAVFALLFWILRRKTRP